MFTRTQYLAHECAHSEYYAQFVTEGLKTRVQNAIGKDRITNSTNPHFNDIPLVQWDNLTYILGALTNAKMKECGDYLTLAGGVCILKEAARQVKSENA